MPKSASEAIREIYGKRLRIRVCGLCFSGEDLLLVKHKGLSDKGYFFSPPGGGMEFGESAEACLEREFYEETGLRIAVEKFLFTHEFLSPPLHAIELFFAVYTIGGRLEIGFDPEMESEDQILESAAYMSPTSIGREKGGQMHHMLNLCTQPLNLLDMQGYFKFEDKTLK